MNFIQKTNHAYNGDIIYMLGDFKEAVAATVNHFSCVAQFLIHTLDVLAEILRLSEVSE